MNNTLTGLGLALVVALLAALIGPWFVNWTAYRDDFAAQASALIGAPVEVSGAVDARLLPTPYVRFRGLSAGTGATRLAVDEIELELAIAPLLRGEFRAERVKLVRPRLGIEALPDGTVRTAFSSAGKKFAAPGRISFDRAEIVDGEILARSLAGQVTVGQIAGIAEAGSLQGPFKFEGEASHGAKRYEARISTARVDAAGALRVKAVIEPKSGPARFEADGALRVAARPGFDGRFQIIRPASPAKAGAPAVEPWRIAGDVKAGAAETRFEALDLVYGPDDRAVRLGGKGLLALNAAPKFDLALESRQIDLDRIVGANRARTPAAMLAAIASELTPGGPPLDGKATLDIRGLVLAGDVVQDLRAEIAADKGAWAVNRFSAALPGSTKLSASGGVLGEAPEFVGTVDFETGDLSGLRRWLGGGEGAATLVRRFAVKGDVSARVGAVSIDDAEIATDGARSTGRLSWAAARNGGERARYEAALVAENLDLDALGIDRLLSHALSTRDADVFLSLDAKALSVWGLSMRDVSIDGSAGAGGTEIKRLSVRDVDGATIAGEGRIAQSAKGPQGRLGFQVTAPRLGPLIALARAGGASDEVLTALKSRAETLAPLKLAIDVEADGKGVRLSAEGDAAGGDIEARAASEAWSLDAPAELDVTIASKDGARLAALAGVALSPVASAEGGEVRIALKGAPSHGMTGAGGFKALGLDVSGRGAVAFAPVVGLSAAGDVSLKSEDLSAVAEALGRSTPGALGRTPAALKAKVALNADGARLEAIEGDVAGKSVSGSLRLPSDPAKPFEGALALDEASVAGLASLGLSPEALIAPDGSSRWPTAAFGPSPVRGLSGRMDVKAKKLLLGGAGQAATDAAFTLAIRRDAVAIERFSAELDGGKLSGSAALSRAAESASLNLALKLDGAQIERIAGQPAANAGVSGAVDLRVEAQGTGRSVDGLMGSLTGAGTLTARDATLRGLDVAAIDKVEPRVEAGLALEAPRIAEVLSRDLGAADFRAATANAAFTIAGGVARIGGVDARSDGARLGGAAALDLRKMVLDADLTLQPDRPDAPQIGVSYEGQVFAPIRKIDATAFTGWLSVRAVERETKRIDAMEADIQERSRIVRERAETERKKAEAEKKRLDEERRKAEAERRKREAEARALTDSLPRPSPDQAPGLPPSLDLSPPGFTPPSVAPIAPGGAFSQGPAAQSRGPERPRATPLPDPLGMPQSILPPAALGPAGR